MHCSPSLFEESSCSGVWEGKSVAKSRYCLYQSVERVISAVSNPLRAAHPLYHSEESETA